MIEVREGLHNGNWQYERSKRTPMRAIRSMFGVLTIGCPYAPMHVFKSSVAMKSALRGRRDCEKSGAVTAAADVARKLRRFTEAFYPIPRFSAAMTIASR